MRADFEGVLQHFDLLRASKWVWTVCEYEANNERGAFNVHVIMMIIDYYPNN